MLFPDAAADANAGETPSVAGWYQVIETDQPGIWDKQRFQISFNSPSNEMEFTLSGFTNQGAGIQGLLADNHIRFARQSVKVVPKGGDGTLEWTLSMEANGTINGKVLEMDYQVFQPNAIAGSGKIRAEKIRP